mmetsp:Transcript_10836/g.24656  ORF Transcript_10836/g.24656 Transcript_10836/m.24656 type:complete len:116 (-) Transcript_10836:23-370(-)
MFQENTISVPESLNGRIEGVLGEYKPNDELSARLADAIDSRKISLIFIVMGLPRLRPFFLPKVIHSCNTCNCLVTVDIWIYSDRANKVYNHCGFAIVVAPKPLLAGDSRRVRPIV